MSAVLRAHGEAFDVELFLADSSLEPDNVYQKGAPVGAPPAGKENGSPRRTSGFNLTVSHADFSDLETQIKEAILFLDEYEDELRRLGSFDGVQGISLDFGVQRRDVAAQTDVLPSDLLWRAGALDIWIAVTHYAIAEPKGEPVA
jgi:hypothetical protein